MRALPDGSIRRIPIVEIKTKKRCNFYSCSALCLLVGRTRFELVTNGLKVHWLGFL